MKLQTLSLVLAGPDCRIVRTDKPGDGPDDRSVPVGTLA